VMLLLTGAVLTMVRRLPSAWAVVRTGIPTGSFGTIV
jgi:hypothetical protein